MHIRSVAQAVPPVTQPSSAPQVVTAKAVQASEGRAPVLQKAALYGSPGMRETLSSEEHAYFEKMFSTETSASSLTPSYHKEGRPADQRLGTFIDRRG